MKISPKISLGLAVLGAFGLAMTSPVHAGTILVTNGSFESPNYTSTSPYYSDDVADGWTGTGSGGTAFGVFDPGISPTVYYNDPIPDGAQVGYINTGALYQDVSATLQPGTTYTLTGYIGNRLDYPGSGSLNLYTGNTFLAGTGIQTPTQGTFGKYSVSYTANAGDSGKVLRVLLNKDSGNQSDFDNITLTSVPEPSTWAAFAFTGLGALGLMLKARKRNGLSS